uniref:Uncharacterized protein n=1 Tax=Arundo donax TaxID=35708 RepID=A0A0A9EN22_ARUDO
MRVGAVGVGWRDRWRRARRTGREPGAS